MFIEIDLQSSQPIYEQAVMQIKFAIAAGSVKEGEMLPSVRDLAKQLTLNPNTIARTYQQLKAEGITITRRGDGIEVAEGAAGKCIAERKDYFIRRFENLFAEAQRSKLPKAELREIINR